MLLRPGRAGPDTVADHRASLARSPADWQLERLVRVDNAQGIPKSDGLSGLSGARLLRPSASRAPTPLAPVTVSLVTVRLRWAGSTAKCQGFVRDCQMSASGLADTAPSPPGW